jgi:hypothetical protein
MMPRCALTSCLARYDKEASRYHQGVYKKKRADLRTVVDNTLSPLFLGQLKNLHKQTLVAFKKELTDALRGDSYNFADVVGSARGKCEKAFLTGAKEARLKDTDWSFDEEYELLKEEIKLVADQCRADETKKMVNQAEVGRVSVCVALADFKFSVCLRNRFRNRLKRPL